MCTVTFVPRSAGYYVAMNRDEQLSRVAGLPPAERTIDGRKVLCPSEPGGGTWIALNDSHATFALINWYSVVTRVKDKPTSRGEVVRAVSSSVSFENVNAVLARFPLHRINPFRLIGFFPETCEIMEWRWDLKRLIGQQCRWEMQQWISSGFDEPAAQRVRGGAFQQAAKQRSAGTLDWLRRLHRSHLPQIGPFSTCMHRPDAATVSYAEIAVVARKATMRYCAAAPCVTRSPDGEQGSKRDGFHVSGFRVLVD